MLGIVRAAAKPWLADAQHELAVAREFVDMPAGGLDVVADPDEIIVVDMDAVTVVAPLVVRAVAAPALHHLAVLVEFDHRRRRHAAFDVAVGRGALFAGVEGARTLVDPDMILRVNGDAADGTDDPVVRKRLRPGGIYGEFRHSLRRGGCDQCEPEYAGERHIPKRTYHCVPSSLDERSPPIRHARACPGHP